MPNENKKVNCHICGRLIRSDTLTRHLRRKDHVNMEEEKERESIASHSDEEDTRHGERESVASHPDGEDTPTVDKKDTPQKYAWRDKGVKRRNHHFLLPRNIRAIIVGPSGVGKTCLTTYLLLQPGMLDYENLVVCGKSLHQMEYRIMRAAFSRGMSKHQVSKIFDAQDDLEQIGKDVEEFIQEYDGRCRGRINATFSDDISSIPDPSEHDPQSKNLLILDDCMLGPQSKCESYYTRGRHNQVCVFYLTQSYFRLPRQTIRENANFYIFFKQDAKNLSHIYQDHCAIDDGLDFCTFRDFCTSVWNGGKHCFVTIDTTRPSYCGKYRKNLDNFWVPPQTP